MSVIRKAAVAGQFYQSNAVDLRSTVEGYLTDIVPDRTLKPKALIAPHAGFVYSGPIAASAYATLGSLRYTIKRVVLLGPCHRVAVRGLALSGADAFETPLGQVEIDKVACRRIQSLDQVQIFDATHEREHSLEVHLPFLQVAIESFKLVPLVVGDAAPEQVAEVIDLLWGGDETLIVVSSDLSHYLDYDGAQELDHKTCSAIEHLDPDAISQSGACGRYPVRGLLNVAKRRNLKVTTLDVRNSGDTAGSKDRVVGYGSWVFTEPEKQAPRPLPAKRPKKTSKITLKPVRKAPAKPLPAEQPAQKPKKRPVASIKLAPKPKQAPEPEKETKQQEPLDEAQFEARTRQLLKDHGSNLLLLSALSIDFGLANNKPYPVNLKDHHAALTRDGASFVTLKKDNQLRGCIGSPQAYRPLVIDVAENAFRAAFADPRFPKVSADEREEIDISVSVLSPQSPLTFNSEEELLMQLRPGTDGLVIEDGSMRALFLPSVWSQLPRREDFLRRLKVKAGMPPNHWADRIKAWRFIAAETSGMDIS